MNNLTFRARRLLMAGALLSLVTTPVFAGSAFSKIIVFGDSLNDFGNMVQFTGGAFPNAPSYAYGRQSNGPVWVEYLAKRLDMSAKIANYAVIGAMTAPAPGFPTGNVWSDTFAGLQGTDVTSQVMDYFSDSGGVADPAALYILQGGSNDFPRVANPAVIVQNLAVLFVALQQHGAKHVVVVTLPDIGKTPRVILGELTGQLPPGTAAYVTNACAQLNQALRQAIAGLTAPDVAVTFADMYAFGDDVVAHPAAYGMLNVQMPYLLSGAGTNPAQWFFWDDLHPTTRGHALFAEYAISALISTYSPRNGRGNGPGLINSLKGLVKPPKG